MSASRKLYTALAAGNKTLAAKTTEADRGMFLATVWGTAYAFKMDNSGFNVVRFLAASGFTDDEVRAYSVLV